MGHSHSIASRITNRRRKKVIDQRNLMSANGAKELRSFLKEDKIDEEECDSGDMSILPDECLASIFQFLGSGDRKQCSLVCRRWLEIDGQSRHRISLNAQSELTAVIPSLFMRFDSVTKLSLKCDRRSASIGDDALVSISERCLNLTRLKLRSCRRLTDIGMANFSKNCKGLKQFSCGSCTFGAKGINAVVENCSVLEELSVKRLRGISDGPGAEVIGPGLPTLSLKFICLKDLYNAQCFGPLMMKSKNLKTLKLFRCSGDWDKLLKMVTDNVDGLVEVHLERLHVTDAGFSALSKCPNLEILHMLKTPDCSNLGLVAVAERCRLLRKLHIDGWKTNRIDDEGLIGVSKYCFNLQELVLIGVNCTRASLTMLATNCQKLERLALCGSETVGDDEISCIAEKCMNLKKLCIKSCPVTDLAMEALAGGCPNLVKVKVKKCRAVTGDGAGLLRASRESLAISLDVNEVESRDAASDDLDVVVEDPPSTRHIEEATNAAAIFSSRTSRSTSFKARLGFITGRSLVSWPFTRCSSFNNGSQGR
ncbi:F-box protein SKIP2-like [Rutidosis leptorrhynchoides]|uniref:F-box protein SKIP2-like n=1 Tax=Rutidosis leptorrhynchoides TaxID=125765 RepID=UPI003A996D2F